MPKTVLIAEDYTDVRKMMKILVQRYGYKVVEAADGYEAVEAAERHQPDLILMDLSMPILDGVTATQAIRRFDGMQKVPIIALTAYSNSYYQKAIDAGCDVVITKPLNFKRLRPLLSQYLS